MRRHHEGGGPQEAVGERRVDVVAALAVGGDQEGQRAVGRQHIHAAVLLAVPGHQRDAALLHVQVRRHRVQSLWKWKGKRREGAHKLIFGRIPNLAVSASVKSCLFVWHCDSIVAS